MSTEAAGPARGETLSDAGSPRARLNLFLVSLLILFLELACIRWFPAHVLFLTFFTNTVLLACFLGMSLGCLAVNHPRNYLRWTPYLLLIALLAGVAVDISRGNLEKIINVGNQASPQTVFFGTEYNVADPTDIRIPIELFAGFFFTMVTLTFVGLGQELGRCLSRLPNRIEAYSINIFGSIVGIVLFAGASWFQLGPWWWFLASAALIVYLLVSESPGARIYNGAAVGALAVCIALASFTSLVPVRKIGSGYYTEQHFWSPYYRIDYNPSFRPADDSYEAAIRFITTNLIGHQQMVSRDGTKANEPGAAYQLPHLLHRDARAVTGQPPKKFEDVLIIGAGSGNDLSRALQWGAGHIDAVEIDPKIQELGKAHHPDGPYDDKRVNAVNDDGRNFLRSTDKQYDLIVYALVDSLVLHSGYSNIRLESYLFTKQAFEDIKRRLKPGGIFVMYNYFRQGWIAARLHQTLEEAFGKDNPVFLCLPSNEEVKTIDHDTVLHGYFTLFFAGDTADLKAAFAEHQDDYYLSREATPGPQSPNGFLAQPPENPTLMRVRRSTLAPSDEVLRTATDDWPFLYLRQPMIPDLSLRGAAMMAGIAIVLLFFFLPRASAGGAARRWSFDGPMFFLGAGFMLIETKAVVHMALLFGSTWMVNSVVFFAVLVMILGANLFVLKVKPEKLAPYYVGLFVSLLLNVLIPLDFFLGMNPVAQIAGACGLVFAPILFAGVIFAVTFRQSQEPDRAFGANIAGAMVGGLAEYSSMLVGFQYLVLVALGFYALSMLRGKPATPEHAEQPLAAAPNG